MRITKLLALLALLPSTTAFSQPLRLTRGYQPTSMNPHLPAIYSETIDSETNALPITILKELDLEEEIKLLTITTDQLEDDLLKRKTYAPWQTSKEKLIKQYKAAKQEVQADLATASHPITIKKYKSPAKDKQQILFWLL